MAMTWKDAAEKVLRDQQKPLNYKDLTQRILKAKLVETRGKTPHLTLHASISVENKARAERGIPQRFDLEGGVVALSEWRAGGSHTGLAHQVKRQTDATKSELLKKLCAMSGDKFESFIETLLTKMGYQDVDLRGGPGDEGIDLLCQMSQGINQVKTAVQAKCKLPKNKVGPKDVRLLRDVLPKFQCSQGVLITTSKFTNEAQTAASEEGRLPIILIDGDRLAELALEHEVGATCHTLKTYSVDTEFELFQ